MDDSGVEWGGTGPTEPVETDKRGWVVLRSSPACDGRNPMTGRVCLLGDHKGYHRDTAGAEWLED